MTSKYFCYILSGQAGCNIRNTISLTKIYGENISANVNNGYVKIRIVISSAFCSFVFSHFSTVNVFSIYNWKKTMHFI